jgi:hypothetical protein
MRARKPRAREDAATAQQMPKKLQSEAEYAEVIRHMIGWLHRQKQALAPDIRNREFVLKRLDQLIVQTEKELAN